MENPSYLILARLAQSSRAVDILANNIANASSPGFKAARLGFAAYLAPAGAAPDQAAPRAQDLTFPQDAGTYTSTQEGTITDTGNSLDVAITGKGWFQVRTPNGIALTRDGAFGLLADGTLATSSGEAVLDASGQPIVIPTGAGKISIAADGTIGSARTGRIGTLGVVAVPDPRTLSPRGENQFVSAAPTVPATRPGLMQGALEQSNVEPVQAVTTMMRANQDFQFAAQFAAAEQTRRMNAIGAILGQQAA